jgi:hypothetical protein
MPEDRKLRRRDGPNREEVQEEWRKLYNEELDNLYPLPYSIRVIKSRRMRRARCVGVTNTVKGKKPYKM